MSSSTSRPMGAASTGTGAPAERSYFEMQRAALVDEIAVSLEHVLANINKLNRSLEGVIAVGNEFGSVEALWSQFEGVMGKDPDAEGEGQKDEDEDEGEHDEASSDGGARK